MRLGVYSGPCCSTLYVPLTWSRSRVAGVLVCSITLDQGQSCRCSGWQNPLNHQCMQCVGTVTMNFSWPYIVNVVGVPSLVAMAKPYPLPSINTPSLDV